MPLTPIDDPTLIAEVAPTGKLRAVINLGNAVLARQQPDSDEPAGVSVDLARAFARLLGLEVELIPVKVAAEAVAAVTEERADIGFFAIDPGRGAGIAFTAPYVLIEGAYLVRNDSPLTDNAQVDAPGRDIVVGKGSAYDLYLSRHIQHASLVRAASSQAVVDTFLSGNHQVAAGVRQQLEADAARVPGLRLPLHGHRTGHGPAPQPQRPCRGPAAQLRRARQGQWRSGGRPAAQPRPGRLRGATGPRLSPHRILSFASPRHRPPPPQSVLGPLSSTSPGRRRADGRMPVSGAADTKSNSSTPLVAAN